MKWEKKEKTGAAFHSSFLRLNCAFVEQDRGTPMPAVTRPLKRFFFLLLENGRSGTNYGHKADEKVKFFFDQRARRNRSL